MCRRPAADIKELVVKTAAWKEEDAPRPTGASSSCCSAVNVLTRLSQSGWKNSRETNYQQLKSVRSCTGRLISQSEDLQRPSPERDPFKLVQE